MLLLNGCVLNVPAEYIYQQMHKIVTLKEEEEKRLDELKRGMGGGNDQVVHLETYFSFIKGLRALGPTTLEKDPEICRKVIHKLVHKIELFPDGYKVHFYVGVDHIDRELASASPGPKASAEAADGKVGFLKNKSSNTLTNGGSGENRTPTPLRALDFESSASTNSTTEPFKSNWKYEVKHFNIENPEKITTGVQKFVTPVSKKSDGLASCLSSRQIRRGIFVALHSSGSF